MEDIIETRNRELADALGISKPVTVTCVKPKSLPLRKLGAVSEGIEPTFSPYFLKHAQARKAAYDKKLLDELCEGIGSVATGRDNPPKLKKPLVRSIDEEWEV